MTTALRIEVAEDRVLARLDRPESRNAIDRSTVDELHCLCAELERDPKVLLLTSGDGIFAADADIAELRGRRRLDDEYEVEQERQVVETAGAAPHSTFSGGGDAAHYVSDAQATTLVLAGTPGALAFQLVAPGNASTSVAICILPAISTECLGPPRQMLASSQYGEIGGVKLAEILAPRRSN